MSSIKAIKVGAISAGTAFVLLIGGFVLGGSLAGAQTPPAETPAPSTVPADPGTTPRDQMAPRDGKECDHMGQPGDGSTGMPSGVRSGPRSGGSVRF